MLRSPLLSFLRLCCVAGVCLVVRANAVDPSASSHFAEDRLAALRAEIAHHDNLYFAKADPEITDAAYDALKRELRSLETSIVAASPQPSSPGSADSLGDDRTGLFATHSHRARVLGLEKVYSETGARAFHRRLVQKLNQEALEFVIEPKVDGLSISATYEHGQLTHATTRGNGAEGDDLSANVVAIENFPQRLARTHANGAALPIPDFIELRGEIYVPISAFKRLNQEREAAGEAPFSNPRNLAAGTVRQTDVAEIRARGLAVVFYGFAACEPAANAPVTQSELHRRLWAWGLPVFSETWAATGQDEMWDAIQSAGRARPALDLPTDGVVIKLDRVALQQELGASETAPHWAFAYKFTPESVETRLRAITLQIGRTGVVTPVAELEPVRLGGSRIARATLHNQEEIARKDLRIGDFVVLEKAGEVIPAITGVNRLRRPAETPPYQFPVTCPACAASLVRAAGEAAVRCPNPACPAQIKRRFEYFASKGCVGIEGLGPAQIATLVDAGRLRRLPDLYHIGATQNGQVPVKLGKVQEKIAAAIERSKSAELWRFIRGLGIPDVGEAAAKELARRFERLDQLSRAEPKDLRGLSASVCAGIRAHFAEPENRAIVADLIAAGVNPTHASVGADRVGR